MADPNWNDGTFSISEYSYVFCEDQDSYYLDPGYGGQPYDVEYLGLFVTDDRVYFGLQTGVDIENPAGSGNLQPGDLTFDIGNDGTSDYGLRFWESTAELLDASSWTNVRYSQHADSNPWRVDGIDGATTSGFDFMIGTGKDGYGYDAFWLEGYIELTALGLTGNDSAIAAHFTMYCGNDNGNAVASVPEPATMLLLGSGLIGFAAVGRRKLAKKKP
jgi:hypothetical protein